MCNMFKVYVSKHELYTAGLKCCVSLDSHTDSMRIESQYCTNALAHSRPNKSSRMAMDEERKLYVNSVNLVFYLIPLQVFFLSLRFISLYRYVFIYYIIIYIID